MEDLVAAQSRQSIWSTGQSAEIAEQLRPTADLVTKELVRKGTLHNSARLVQQCA